MAFRVPRYFHRQPIAYADRGNISCGPAYTMLSKGGVKMPKSIVRPVAGQTLNQPPYGDCIWLSYNELSSGQRAQAAALDPSVRGAQSALCLVVVKTGRVVRVLK